MKDKKVKGSRYTTRPSASHYYNILKMPVGYKITYKLRKGGKNVLHSLQLRKNGVPYWKPDEVLKTKRSNTKIKKQQTKKRKTYRKNKNRTKRKQKIICFGFNSNLMKKPKIIAPNKLTQAALV